jgi:hypothetical protein
MRAVLGKRGPDLARRKRMFRQECDDFRHEMRPEIHLLRGAAQGDCQANRPAGRRSPVREAHRQSSS